ncbi:putative u1 zinc finger protein [Golovinomyces cichoracearum]|uniref:Putative u1 zinc finger protein n=1 Tax=Golovinomyces cichoracearum TaxID=62708 RepID=A0A420IVV8_9PEZI|nr:putative u1 zinc finger protein [Golovinomyces cichoracearum]
MSEYWKYWCKHCKTFVRDTKLETANHNASPKHQGNLKRFLRDLQRNHDRDEKEKERAKSEVMRLNGLVSSVKARSEGSNSSKVGSTQTHYSTTTTCKNSTEIQRKQNLAQLAEMGIDIPTELRPEMAMPGEWQVVSERIIVPGESKKIPDMTSTSVRRRRRNEDCEEEDEEDEEEREAHQPRKKWGYLSMKQPNEEDDRELDALLTHVTQEKIKDPKSEPSIELKKENEGTDQLLDKSQDTLQGDNSFIKNEPCETVNLPPSLRTEENQESLVTSNVVFKKRKAKNIRQK